MKRFVAAVALVVSLGVQGAEVGGTCAFDSECGSELICKHHRKKGMDGKLRLTPEGVCSKGSHVNRTAPETGAKGK